MIDKSHFLTSDGGDTLLIEEEHVLPLEEVKCDACTDGFITEKNIARPCEKCREARTIAIRRSKLNNIPKHLRRFPIKFDVPITLTVMGTDFKPGKSISDLKKIENKFNDTIFPMLDKGSNFYIFGNNGSGKTMVACGIAVKYIDDGKSAVFAMSPELFDMAFSASSMTANQKQVYYADLLIIDNFGSEFVDAKNFKTSFMSKLLSTRLARGKPTIITSSMTRPDALDGVYGKSLASLLKSNFIFLHMTSKSNYTASITSSGIDEFIGDE